MALSDSSWCFPVREGLSGYLVAFSCKQRRPAESPPAPGLRLPCYGVDASREGPGSLWEQGSCVGSERCFFSDCGSLGAADWFPDDVGSDAWPAEPSRHTGGEAGGKLSFVSWRSAWNIPQSSSESACNGAPGRGGSKAVRKDCLVVFVQFRRDSQS